MKGSAQTICLIVFATVVGSLANKPKKQFKKFPPPPGGPRFLQPFVPVPPFRLSPLNSQQSSAPLDPYACLPKYLCVIEDKKGEKRTAIVHGLHPALRKAKPNVIDPSNLPKVTGGTKPFTLPTVSDSSDDDVYREREFDDSFLKQQELAETMAFLEEKRRQFLYQQGMPKQKIIPKDVENPADEDEQPSKESKEEEEKSQEVSKEEKEEEAEKSVEVSKEEEKDEPEESVEAEDEVSSGESSAQAVAKLSKYKIKKKASAFRKRNNGFKSRMDEYDDADMMEDQLATVPWDDRVRNDSDPLKPKEIYDKLFGKVLPFQLPSLPKIARNIPGMSFLASADDEDEVTTTTTQRPGIFKRMFKAVTGSGSAPSQATHVKKRYGKPMPMRRYKRDTETNVKYISDDVKIAKQIRDPARQCRMIYKGCDLPYEHIMKMVSTGQVLIENDPEAAPTTKKPTRVDPNNAQDDEAEQAIRDKLAPKKSKPIPQLLAQAHLGTKKKPGVSGLPIFGKNKKPIYDGSEEFSDAFQRPKQKKRVASLPLLPMRYQWGKPTYTIHGKPFFSNGPSDFSGGILNPTTVYKTPAPQAPVVPTTTTTERPLFAASPLDKKDNYSIPYQHSVIKLNKTHAVHVLKKKPYNPAKTRTRDAKGRPVSFSTVFTEIAGNSGGIHDFFDRISGAFGGDNLKETGREFPSTFPGGKVDSHGNPQPQQLPYRSVAKPTAFPSAPIPSDTENKEDDNSAERDDDEDSDEEEGDEDNDDQEEGEEEAGNENTEQDEEGDENNDQDEEGDENNDEEEGDDNDQEQDIADDVGESAAPTQNQQQQNQQQQNQQPIVGQPQEEALVANYASQTFAPAAPSDKKKPEKKNNQQQPQHEEEEDEEEEEEDEAKVMEEIMSLSVPPFIKQSMMDDYKKKKLEKEKEAQGDDDDDDDEQGEQPHSPEGPQQGGPSPQHGGPGGGRPGAPGASGAFGRPSLFGSQQQGPPQQGGSGGGLFSFLG